MIFASCAWVGEHGSDASFEANAPYQFVGEQLQAYGFRGRFVLIFLEGCDKLSAGYRSRLRQLGFDVVDFAAETRRLAARFPALQQLDRYGFFCFIRWIALRSFLAQENVTGQVVHLDGDIVFNATPDEIAADFRDLTFVLQGCPAVASITNHDWFAIYEEELVKFTRDVDSYSASAFANRAGWLQSARQKWAGVWEGPRMTHDQDLICYLIHTDKIVQDRPALFAKAWRLYYTQNPYWLHEGAEIQLGRDSGLTFSTRENVCYLEQKKIALWHFQSFFAAQLANAVALHRAGFRGRYPGASSSTMANGWTRKELYRSIRELSPANPDAAFSFSDYYNREQFWVPGVFSNSQPT